MPDNSFCFNARNSTYCFTTQNFWELGADISRLYYASDTRADALLIGCLAGFMISWNVLPKSKKIDIYLKFLMGIATIFLIFMIATSDSYNPILYQQAGYTIVALSVAVILVWLVNYPSKIILLILQFAPLVWIGRVSYILYLWHWPFRFFLYQGENLPPSIFYLILTVILSFFFATFSYYLIEKPFLRLKPKFSALS